MKFPSNTVPNPNNLVPTLKRLKEYHFSTVAEIRLVDDPNHDGLGEHPREVRLRQKAKQHLITQSALYNRITLEITDWEIPDYELWIRHNERVIAYVGIWAHLDWKACKPGELFYDPTVRLSQKAARFSMHKLTADNRIEVVEFEPIVKKGLDSFLTNIEAYWLRT